LELIVLETIRCKLGGEEGHLLVRFSSMVGWLSLYTKPLWFSFLYIYIYIYIYIFLSTVLWSSYDPCCLFLALIFVEPLGGL
jgi:hypothetical protein